MRTSDRARIDADGFLWILGRLDDVIIRGGFKVDLGKVEEALRAHPSVDEALAVGLPDQRLGSVPAALVVVRNGHHYSESDIIESTRGHLPPYGIPTRLLRVPEIPRTATMKPARAEAVRLLTT